MRGRNRIEFDSLGSVEVPEDALWGAQTQRALANFPIGKELVPIEIIYALANIKKAAAHTNHSLGILNTEKKNLIEESAYEISKGLHDEHFPLKIWQSGSGTQTNMNINEVISNLSSIASKNPLGSHKPVHPNDDVNKSQSTNDVFPSAIHIATAICLTKDLLPELKNLIKILDKKVNQWSNIIKIGRTHLQDAVPLTLGQEVSAWREQVKSAYNRIERGLTDLYELPIGGTAIGTGLNTPESFDREIVKELELITGLPFVAAENKFALMASHDGLVNIMTQLKMLAVSLLKIVNDIRLLSCGPRAGIGELILPANEPGSSIMPGKINPTQCEAMAMICTQIIGLDTATSIAGSGGHLQMNSYKPLIALNLIQSIKLLTEGSLSCRVAMIEGIEPNEKNIKNFLNQSLMLITALTPLCGYEKAAEIAQLAHKQEISLRESALKLGYVEANKFDEIIDPSKMINKNI